MVDRLLLKDYRQRPAIMDILSTASMVEKIKKYGYTVPSEGELRIGGDRNMPRMVAAQKTDNENKLKQILNSKTPPSKIVDEHPSKVAFIAGGKLGNDEPKEKNYKLLV